MARTRKHSLAVYSKSPAIPFMRMLDCIKLFHWNTKVYAKHKATDELHSSLGKLVDSYIEKYIGEKGRFNVKDTISYTELSDNEFIREIHTFKSFLIHLPNASTDLSNIRDEMLGEVNQFLYLWTLQ